MSDWKDFLTSGILEMYVMGHTSPEESLRVEEMAADHEEIRIELALIETTLQAYAQQHAVQPDPGIKPFLMATIDYIDRMEHGERPSFPPVLDAGSTLADYATWLDNEQFKLEEPLQEVQARIIGYSPHMTTAIVWLERGAPPETHTDELERFLIVEGTCNIMVGDEDNHLKAGDFFSIPLHRSHQVIVTSQQPCKVILQRIAA